MNHRIVCSGGGRGGRWAGGVGWVLLLVLGTGCQREVPNPAAVASSSAVAPAPDPTAASSPDALRLLDEAMAAHGGAAALARLRANVVTQQGMLRLGGAELPFTSKTWEAPPDCLRVETTLQEHRQGLKVMVKYIEGLAGRRGWAVAGEEPPVQLDGDQLASLKENRYYGQLVRLIDLKEPGFILARLRDGQVEGKAVQRLEVRGPGQPVYILSFDQENKLLVKTEAKVHEPNINRVQLQEVFFSDYRDVGGLKYAFRQSVWWDGNRVQTAEVTELMLLKEVDPALFSMPKK